MVAAVFQESLHAISLPEFAASCDTCPELTQPRGQRQTGWPKCRNNVTPELAPYFNVRDELVVDDSFIMRGTDRLIVPLRPRVIDLAHEGHQGLVRTKQRLCELYWWPQMDNYVYNMTASCVSCQYTDKTTKTAPAPLIPVDLPNGPWEKVGIDITGPFNQATWDCHYATTLVTVTTEVDIQFLATVFGWEGNPSYLVSDNGCQFTSHTFANFLREREIKHLHSSVYYPRANGAIERFNRVLKECLQTAVKMHRPWKQTVLTELSSHTTCYNRSYTIETQKDAHKTTCTACLTQHQDTHTGERDSKRKTTKEQRVHRQKGRCKSTCVPSK